MSLPYTIPTRTSKDLNSAADVNALMADIQYLYDNRYEIPYPIGSTYEQLPDDSGTFDADEEPGALFGGTWAKQWDDEGVFFRTEGYTYSESDETGGRSSGVQRSQMQLLQGKADSYREYTDGYNMLQNASGVFSSNNAGSANTTTIRWTRTTTGTSLNRGEFIFSSAGSANARTSATTSGETRPTNRLIRKWKRMA
jgi:hypothetical protein